MKKAQEIIEYIYRKNNRQVIDKILAVFKNYISKKGMDMNYERYYKVLSDKLKSLGNY